MRRKLADTPTLQRADDPRMERLEQAVDSIAVEVERISESQRFISKLMDERSKEQARLR